RTLKIFEDLYQGVGEAVPTTDDNRPSYMLPIGRLNDSVRARLQDWREDAVGLRRRAEDLGQEARERLSDVREGVMGQIGELRAEVKRQAKKFRKRRDR
ncbi:MAG: hypothetical protein EBW36_05785, partial [Actinobacteria bacterium]|nr:hypothetical protein [Actinomycetota bacterium]